MKAYIEFLLDKVGSDMVQRGTKNQHYVPQFYLKKFSCDEKVYVYHKESRKIFQTNIKNICCQNHLYETAWKNPPPTMEKYILYNQLEKELSKKENDYAHLLDKIIRVCCNDKNYNSLICSRDEKMLLYSFISNLLCRSEWYIKEISSESQDDIINKPEMQVYCEVVEELKLGDFETYVYAASKQIVLDEEMQGSSAYSIKEQLQMMEFCFFVTQEDAYITTDFPFIYTFLDSDENKLSTLFCPIHPRIGVLFFEINSHKELHKYRNRVKYVDAEDVFKLNKKNLCVDKAEYLIAKDVELLKQML